MNIKVNGIYKHFKGDYYLVIDIAYNAEDMSKWVVYRSLYGDGKLFIRSLDDFLMKVDKEKYPNCDQVNRFELQKIKSVRGK